MIQSFKHQGLQNFFETGSVAGIQPIHRNKIRMRLTALETATTLQDMALPVGPLTPLTHHPLRITPYASPPTHHPWV